MSDSTSISVAQFSDTHFLADGEVAEGGFAYDTSAAFEAVRAGLGDTSFDLITVTGDVTDHGRPDQYRVAAAALSQLNGPVNVCPGNHDQADAFAAGMGRPTVATSRVVEIGNWCFIFADSNAGVMTADESGRLVDPDDYEDRLHGNGSLGAAEVAWIRKMHDATLADHVFIWVHHPPAAGIGMIDSHDYDLEWLPLVKTEPLEKLRGIGAGHTHVPDTYEFEGAPVFIAPSLKNNFDLTAETLMPPGYRRYEFGADGSIATEAHMFDEEQWPRRPMSRLVVSLFNGDIGWDDFNAIVARKTAERAAAEG